MISTEDNLGTFMIADHVDAEAAVSNLYAPFFRSILGNIPYKRSGF
jgi:hypothetical protein